LRTLEQLLDPDYINAMCDGFEEIKAQYGESDE